MELKEQIADWLKPVLDEEKLFLVEVKISGKKVEIFADGDSGISIGQCAVLSRFAESKLDGSGLINDNYELDVSSPGLTSPLRVPRQYKRRIGETLEILQTDGTTLEGILESADDNGIVIQKSPKIKTKSKTKTPKTAEEEPKIVELKYGEIKRALLQFKWQ